MQLWQISQNPQDPKTGVDKALYCRSKNRAAKARFIRAAYVQAGREYRRQSVYGASRMPAKALNLQTKKALRDGGTRFAYGELLRSTHENPQTCLKVTSLWRLGYGLTRTATCRAKEALVGAPASKAGKSIQRAVERFTNTLWHESTPLTAEDAYFEVPCHEKPTPLRLLQPVLPR